MKIYYKKNNFNNIENIENICNYNKKFITKAGSRARIFELKFKDKQYINKNYTKNNKSKKDFEIEKNKFFLVKKRSKNNILFKNFFIQYILISECNNNYIIIMDKIDYNLDSYFLKNIINEEKNNLLFQALVTIYDMNHYNKIFFNDIYHKENIRNIMILNNNNKRNIEYYFNDNIKIIIPINKYQIKFIDYGKINIYPEFRTTEYMEEYFNNLFNENIISETILFTFFYLINCSINKNNVLLLINKILSIILRSNELNNIESNNFEKNKNIDYLFIYYLSVYLSSRPNFYNI
jgi:hypothetical protein